MIIPYSCVNGVWTLPDEVIVGLWNKAESQGLISRTFREGEISGANDFLMLMKSPANIPLLLVDDGYNPIAVAWVNSINKGHGYCHFFCFKEFWGNAEEKVKEILDYWFNLGDPPVFKTLIGITPEVNKQAINFVKKIGFTELGAIPHVGVVTYKTREIHYG